MRTALVLGGALCVWEDVEAALQIGEHDGVVACNDIAADWPGPVDGAVSLHTELWPEYLARRASKGLEPIARTFAAHDYRQPRAAPDGVETTSFRFVRQTASGSSGLFALKVALIDLGFDRAVLCGVPMIESERHYTDPRPWRGAGALRRGWVEALPAIGDRARSMSGWTADLLGRPPF